MASIALPMRVYYKPQLKTRTYIFRLRINAQPYNLTVEDELIALESLLQSAVQREMYELAAIIKERMDFIRGDGKKENEKYY